MGFIRGIASAVVAPVKIAAHAVGGALFGGIRGGIWAAVPAAVVAVAVGVSPAGWVLAGGALLGAAIGGTFGTIRGSMQATGDVMRSLTYPYGMNSFAYPYASPYSMMYGQDPSALWALQHGYTAGVPTMY